MDRDRKPSRREFVKGLSIAGVGATAGCIGPLRNEDNDEPMQDGENSTNNSTEENGSSDDTQSEPKIQSFVEVDGTDLVIDGKEAYLFGTRPMHVMPFTEPKEEIDLIFDHLNRIGATLARVHAFQPFWGEEQLQPEPGEYNEEVMQRLDQVIEAGRQRGIRVSLMLMNAMPAFHNAESIDDNYGVNAHTYANYADSADEYNDFYRNRECKQLYKKRVSSVLTRENSITGMEYREDPAIAILELGNEIEWNEHWKRDSSSLQSWIREMSDYVRTIDDNHLITTGQYGWAGRSAFVKDHQPKNIDICSLHYYPGPNGGYNLPNDSRGDHPDLLRRFINKGQEEVGKPVYVSEYTWKVKQDAEEPLPKRNEELSEMHRVMNEEDLSACTHHALGRDENQDYPRGSSTSYADSDENTMKEFRRFGEIQFEKSEEGVFPPLESFEYEN